MLGVEHGNVLCLDVPPGHRRWRVAVCGYPFRGFGRGGAWQYSPRPRAHQRDRNVVASRQSVRRTAVEETGDRQVQHLDLMRPGPRRRCTACPARGTTTNRCQAQHLLGLIAPACRFRYWSWPIRNHDPLPGCSRWNSRSVSTVKLGPRGAARARPRRSGALSAVKSFTMATRCSARPSGGRPLPGRPAASTAGGRLQLLQRERAKARVGRGGRVEAAAEQSRIRRGQFQSQSAVGVSSAQSRGRRKSL